MTTFQTSVLAVVIVLIPAIPDFLNAAQPTREIRVQVKDEKDQSKKISGATVTFLIQSKNQYPLQTMDTDSEGIARFPIPFPDNKLNVKITVTAPKYQEKHRDITVFPSEVQTILLSPVEGKSLSDMDLSKRPWIPQPKTVIYKKDYPTAISITACEMHVPLYERYESVTMTVGMDEKADPDHVTPFSILDYDGDRLIVRTTVKSYNKPQVVSAPLRNLSAIKIRVCEPVHYNSPSPHFRLIDMKFLPK